MLFFFTAIITLIILMFSALKQEVKRTSDDFNAYKESSEKGKIYHKAVFQYCNNYYQTKTGKSVYKKTDSENRQWWYYTKTGEPMEYIQSSEMIQNGNFEAVKARDSKKKWFTLINYWDDSIFTTEPFTKKLGSHLDDYTIIPDFITEAKHREYLYKTIKWRSEQVNLRWNNYCNMTQQEKEKVEEYFKDNDSCNQKIYIKNMKPYQLTGIINSNKANYSGIHEVQYLIRFTKGFNPLDKQKNIYEKEISELWTKWYAITKEEYEELTNLSIENYFLITIEMKQQLQKYIEKQYTKIKDDIAFMEGIEEPNWNLDNCGILKAFDNNGNFIGE